MNTQIYLRDILLDYDTPQLFVARDSVGTSYVCMLVEQNEDFDRFICISISEQKLVQFTNGQIDLRDIFLTPEINRFYQINIHDYQSNYFESIPLEIEELPQAWLPDEGVSINLDRAQSEVVLESKEKARTIIHLNLNPPESINEPRINALALSEALLRFQTMLKYAYKKSISSFPYAKRKQLNIPENYQVDVFAFAQGSFKVKMQSQSYPNLFGETEIIKALELVDQLVDSIDDIDGSLRLLAQNKGHFANTFINFLKYIAESKSRLNYTWAYSGTTNPVTKQITSDQAEYLYGVFNQQDELKEESVELVGYFEKVDEKYGKWRLVDRENNTHNGELGEVEGLTLKGVIIRTTLYRLVCVEKIVEVVGTSEEKKSIQLIELTPIDSGHDTEQRH